MDSLKNWAPHRNPFPLNASPRILNAGLAQHGRSRTLPPPLEHHCHREGVWALHAHQYSAALTMQGVRGQVHAGYLSLVPPQVGMEFQFPGPCQHYYVLFEARPEDRESVLAPLMQDLGSRLDQVNEKLGEIVGLVPLQPGRAEALFWSLLFELLASSPQGPALPGKVVLARQQIENRLSEKISVAGLARHLEISHNQLNRQFEAALGVTVTGYITSRRMERAIQLLRHTTRPVKSIATEVGLGDVQALNKCLRRFSGLSPRQVRNGVPPDPANPVPSMLTLRS